MEERKARNNPLLIAESPMQFLPSLACVLGVEGALFAQQLHYWLNANHKPHYIDDRPWIYNTLDEWNLQFPFWSKSTLRRVLKKLQAVEVDGETYHIVLVANHNKDKMNHCQWFTLDYDELDRLVPVAQKMIGNMQKDIAENSPAVQRKIVALSRRYPALVMEDKDDVSESTHREEMSDVSESAHREEMFDVPESTHREENFDVSKSAERSVQNEHIVENPRDSANVQDERIENPSMCRNQQNEVSKMNTSKCSKWSHRCVQNELPTNNTIDYRSIDYRTRDILSPSLSPSPSPSPSSSQEKETEKETKETEKIGNEEEAAIAYLKSLCQNSGLSLYANDTRTMKTILRRYPIAQIVAAIKIAAEHNARAFSYVVSVLQNNEKGATTHEKASRPSGFNREPSDEEIYRERQEKFWKEHGY